jgi:hypothetical protein
MAQKEAQSNPDSPAGMSAFAACFGAIAMMCVIMWSSRANIYNVGIAFCIPIGISFLLQIAMAISSARSASYR